MNEKLEKLNRQLAQGEARLRRAQHEEKILEHQMKQLTRKERTHRLCTRGAMLESFLIRPESKGATIHRSSRCVAPCRGLPAESG